MAIQVITTDPRGLLRAIKEAIDSKSITSWEYDHDDRFTQTSPEWQNKMWLQALKMQGILGFKIIGESQNPHSQKVYSAYHGKLTELLLSNFNSHFSLIQATATVSQVDMFLSRGTTESNVQA